MVIPYLRPISISAFPMASCSSSGTSRSRENTGPDGNAAVSVADFAPGTLLRHKSFGTGRIIWLDEEKMTVDFGRKGKKTFLMSLVLENDIVKRI